MPTLKCGESSYTQRRQIVHALQVFIKKELVHKFVGNLPTLTTQVVCPNIETQCTLGSYTTSLQSFWQLVYVMPEATHSHSPTEEHEVVVNVEGKQKEKSNSMSDSEVTTSSDDQHRNGMESSIEEKHNDGRQDYMDGLKTELPLDKNHENSDSESNDDDSSSSSQSPRDDDEIATILTPHGREYKALKRAKKVLIVTPAFPPNISFGGGVAITYDALCRRLRKRGATVKVLSPQCNNLDGGTPNVYPGFKLIVPNFPNLQRIWHCVGEADVVIVPDSIVAQYVIFFGRLKHTPVINNVHTNVKVLLQKSTSKWNPIPPLADFFLALNTWLATVAYTTSPSYTKVLRKRGYRVVGSFSPRIKTQIFNDHDEQQAIAQARDYLTKGQPEKPLLLYVGRWSVEKRIHLLAKAKPDGVICAVVGDGPLSDKINELHDEETGFHVFQGMQPQARLRVLYKAADLLVSASDFETLGMTVLEAHLCGTPAVVQDATGFNTQIIKHKNGYLIDYADTAAAKEFLIKVLRKPPKRKDVLKTTTHKGWDSDLPQLDDIVDTVAGFRVGSKLEWPTIVLFFLWLLGVYITLGTCMRCGMVQISKAKEEVRPKRSRRGRRRRHAKDSAVRVT